MVQLRGGPAARAQALRWPLLPMRSAFAVQRGPCFTLFGFMCSELAYGGYEVPLSGRMSVRVSVPYGV